MQYVNEGLLILLLAGALVTDVRSSRIPNWLTFPAMLFACLSHTWFNGISGLLFCIAGAGTGFGLFLMLYATGTIGAGDVKFMAAIGAIIGAYGAFTSALLTIMVGGVYALGAMIYQWGFVDTGRKMINAVQGTVLIGSASFSRELALPFRLRYGVAIAGGTLLFSLGLHPFGG